MNKKNNAVLSTNNCNSININNRTTNSNIAIRNTVLMAVLAVGLSGCQTTTSPTSLTQQSIDNPAQFTKSTLNAALSKQNVHAYAYQTNVMVSNENRRHALSQASPLQLSMSDNPSTHCDSVHDAAYVALIDYAADEGSDIDDDKYAMQREQIKQENLKCHFNMTLLQDNTSQDATSYQSYQGYQDSLGFEDSYKSYEENYDTDDARTIREMCEAVQDAENKIAINKTAVKNAKATDNTVLYSDTNPLDAMNDDILPDTEETISPVQDTTKLDESIYDVHCTNDDDANLDIDGSDSNGLDYESDYLDTDYLPYYDDNHTKLDAKKAKLLDAYLLKPTTIEMQGVYQPRRGVVTLLPSLQYQTRNHTTAFSQPIYIDAKRGIIYIWADNLAYPVSTLLDKKLGGQWHNKWLKIQLKDGTLPDGFGRDLIKAHFEALHQADTNVNIKSYQQLNVGHLNSLMPSIAPDHLAGMYGANYVVSREFNPTALNEYATAYFRTFYDCLSQQYPELIESEVEPPVSTIDNDAIQTDDSQSEYNKTNIMSNKAVMTKVLAMMKASLERHSIIDSNVEHNGNIHEESDVTEESYAEQKPANQYTNQQTHLIDYAQIATVAKINENNFKLLTEIYGLDSNKDIVWRLRRVQMPDKNELDVETGEGLTIDSFTQYSTQYSKINNTIYYPTLPLTLQTPNAENSIDVKEYSQALLNTYKEGEGTKVGQLLYSFAPLLKMMMVTDK